MLKATATLTEAQLRRIVVDQAGGVRAADTAAALGLSHKKVTRVRSGSYKAALKMRVRLGLPQPRRPARKPTRWQDYW
jgi:hypothetical protein